MKIILGLMTFFFSIILIVSIMLFIWDRFFKKDDNTMKAHKIMTETEEDTEKSRIEEGESLIKESEQKINENETIDKYEMVEVHKRKF